MTSLCHSLLRLFLYSALFTLALQATTSGNGEDIRNMGYGKNFRAELAKIGFQIPKASLGFHLPS